MNFQYSEGLAKQQDSQRFTAQSEEEEDEMQFQSDEDFEYFYKLPPANPIKVKPQIRELLMRSYYAFDFIQTPQSLDEACRSETKESAFKMQNAKVCEQEHTVDSYCWSNQSRLVYQKYDHALPTYLCDLNTAPTLQRQSQSIQLSSPCVCFSSEFESGNLFAVYAKGESTYDLLVQNDTNSKGNTQWFYFCLWGARKSAVLTFNILNFYKQKSLFQVGLHPAIFSLQSNSWVRGGFDICYGPSSIRKASNKPYYQLTFSYQVESDNDCIYFAHSYPYTYSRLQHLLNESALSCQKYLHRKTLCKSLAQNYIDVLTITSNNIEVTYSFPIPSKNRNDRKVVVLLARQHSGETMGSYVIEGILKLLLSETQTAQQLRSLCVFKIIPMLNPDGVIHGNYRTSLSGLDLNRQWKNPSKHLYPEIYYTKSLIQQLHADKGIYMVCDIHGHSKKYPSLIQSLFRLHSFFYGCTGKNYIKPRLFPYLLSKASKQFSFSKSCFNTASKQKEKTARIQLWKITKLYTIYTLENSFYGWYENQKRYHYQIQDYFQIGETFCEALLKLVQDEQSCKKNSQQNLEEIKQELLTNKDNYDKHDEEDESGSDSEISEQELDKEVYLWKYD